MTPVDALIERPGGSPVAEYVSVWPSGSLALISSETGAPSAFDWLPGFTTTGGRFTLFTVHVKVTVRLVTPSDTVTVATG